MAPIPQKLIRHQDAETLAAGYGRSIRWLEMASIGAWFLLVGWVVARLWAPALVHPWLTLGALFCGYLAADFISGFVHWAADTWGSTELPLVGKALIRPFREHHVDQKAITRHDFIETNGNNCLISLPTAILALLIPLENAPAVNVFACTFLLSLVIWVLCTNQFHKWSHMDTPPRAIQVLQRLHLILPVAHHQEHHTAPYAKHYCITVGWLNWPLQKIGFFRTLEQLITVTTGALPRKDDIGERAAAALLEAEAEAAGNAPSHGVLTPGMAVPVPVKISPARHRG